MLSDSAVAEMNACVDRVLTALEAWQARLDGARDEATAKHAAAVLNAHQQTLNALSPGDMTKLGEAALLALDLGPDGAELLETIRRLVAIVEMDIRRDKATSRGGSA